MVSLAGAAVAAPTTPTLTHLYTANLTVSKPISAGVGPLGARQIIPFVGGTFAGPKLNGMLSLPPPLFLIAACYPYSTSSPHATREF